MADASAAIASGLDLVEEHLDEYDDDDVLRIKENVAAAREPTDEEADAAIDLMIRKWLVTPPESQSDREDMREIVKAIMLRKFDA